MSLSDNYPDIRSVWMNDYANAGVIDPRCSFARSDSTPSNVHYWSDEDHLSSENLILQSENFTTTWAIQDASGAAGATAPDGGTDGYTVTAYTGSSKGPRASQSLSGKLSTSTQYTMVGHVKAGTATHGYISFRGTNSNNYAYAQIEFASPSSPSTGGVGFTSISGTVTALGSSWYRLTLTATTGSDVSGAFAFLGVNDGTAFGISGYPIWTSAGETLEVWGAQLSTTQAKTYDSPTTTQIHREYAATLKPVAYSGQPRFEYEPTGDRSAKGLLIESQSQNLIPYSSAINSWVTKGNVTITDAAAVGPNGTLSASLVRPTGATSLQHYIRENITTVASSSYTFSAYVKPAGYTKLLLVGEQTAWPYTDYVNATFTLTGAGSVTTGAGSATITALSDGWYQITATGTAATTSSYALISVLNDAGDLVYTADSYSGILITAVQYEQNSFQSSYIATSGSASTRTGDSLSVATADIGYTGGPFTLMAEATSPGETSYYAPAALHLDNSNQVVIYTNSFQGRLAAATSDGTANTLLGVRADGKTILSGDTNDLSAVMNGATPVTDSSYVLPDLSGANLYIGSRNGSSSPLNGHIKRVALYSEALTDTELQSLTS